MRTAESLHLLTQGFSIGFCAGMAKLQPADCIWPADQFNLAHQISCTFFSSTTFPTVDSSVTALTACLLLTCLLQQNLDASSTIKV